MGYTSSAQVLIQTCLNSSLVEVWFVMEAKRLTVKVLHQWEKFHL